VGLFLQDSSKLIANTTNNQTMYRSSCVSCITGSFKTSKGTQACDFCGAPHPFAGTTYEHTYGDINTPVYTDAHCLPCPQFSGQNASIVGSSGYILNEWYDCLCFGGYENISYDNCDPCPQYMFKIGYLRDRCAYCANGSYFTLAYQECGTCGCMRLNWSGTYHRKCVKFQIHYEHCTHLYSLEIGLPYWW
jgi:hypothetical protein